MATCSLWTLKQLWWWNNRQIEKNVYVVVQSLSFSFFSFLLKVYSQMFLALFQTTSVLIDFDHVNVRVCYVKRGQVETCWRFKAFLWRFKWYSWFTCSEHQDKSRKNVLTENICTKVRKQLFMAVSAFLFLLRLCRISTMNCQICCFLKINVKLTN